MIFHEIYSAYYHAVSHVIKRILEGGAREEELEQIVRRYAFEESVLTILPSLKRGKWQLVRKDLTTPLAYEPSMPVTILEKRWLKAISLDKRMKLFAFDGRGLEDIEPLFTQEDYCAYDRYSDGDPYDDEQYIEHFRTILAAVREKTPVTVEMTNRRGGRMRVTCIPLRLEYSERDDKFRVITGGCRNITFINLARIRKCSVYRGETPIEATENPVKMDTVTLEITDERNALERALLHFSHFEKWAESIGGRKYRLHIRYSADDETEIGIRILSFGPLIKVVAPESFVNFIKEKLKKQKNCGLE